MVVIGIRQSWDCFEQVVWFCAFEDAGRGDWHALAASVPEG